MTLRRCLPVLVLATAGALAAEDYSGVFERAVNAIDFEFQERWAYTETLVTGKHVWVGRYDPRRPDAERWQLFTIDERKPTNEEIAEYRKDHVHDHEDRGDKRVRAMVAPESIRLVEENDTSWLFAFRPDEEEDAFLESVEAKFRVNKAGGYLEYIDIRNHSPIKPAVIVKISKLITRLTFGPAAEGGPIVPTSSHVEAKGRAFLVVSFNEQEISRNSDFEYAGDKDLNAVED